MAVLVGGGGPAYGIGDRGAALLCPDGHIAWRVTDAPTKPVDAAAAMIIGRKPARGGR